MIAVAALSGATAIADAAPAVGEFKVTGDPCPLGWALSTAGSIDPAARYGNSGLSVDYAADGPLVASTSVSSTCRVDLPILRASLGGFMFTGSTALTDSGIVDSIRIGRWAHSYTSPSGADTLSFTDVNTPGAPTTITSSVICNGVSNGFGYSCPGADDSSAYGTISASVQNLTFADDFAPTATITGSPSGDWRDTQTLQIDASDRDPGSGLKTAQLVVDGQPVASVELSTGTRFEATCVDNNGSKTFSTAQPCAPSATVPLRWNSSAMPDGAYVADVLVSDASGRTATIAGWPRTITLHNAPTLVTDPSISGTARVGNALTADSGNWTGSPTSYSYQWFSDGAAIAGATDASYTPAAGDAYKTLSVSVTAHNARGSGGATAATAAVADEDGFTTPTTPSNLAAPTITGTLRVGSRPTPKVLAGTWTDATSTEIEWLRCQPDATAVRADGKCTPLGSSDPSYSLTTDDQYHRLAVRIVARNHRRSASAYSAVTPIVADVDGNTSRPAGGRSTTPGPKPTTPLPPGVPARVVPAWPNGIDGLVNPLAANGGSAPNGRGDTTTGRYETVGIKTPRKLVKGVKGRANHRWTVVGRLVDRDGHGIGGALVTAVTRVPAGAWRAEEVLRTGSDGRFELTTRSATSEAVRFAYFAAADSSSATLSPRVTIGSYAHATLVLGRRTAHAGDPVAVRGTVAGASTVAGGVLVQVQLFQPGFRWMPIGQVRTDSAGRWRLRYPTRAGLPPHTVAFRAVIASQGSWPYLTTTTRARSVAIR